MSFVAILPVLLFEYLSISLARTILPGMIIAEYGSVSYIVIGVAEAIKGLLAFWACPAIGKLSDRVGRKPCLLLSMVGTTLPTCLLALTSNMWLYLIFFSLSGVFAGTFTLTFAYISDCVEKRKRAPAYGLALATFGFSFTVGPVVGSVIAEMFGPRIVFFLSTVLVCVNLVYILYFLPETSDKQVTDNGKFFSIAMDHVPGSWSVSESLKVFREDKFMTQIGIIIFMYYTAVWAMISTLMLYVTKYLHVSSVSLGWLLSGYGVSTMVSESVLVRLIVPALGEVNSIRLGLLAFAIQCVLIAFSTSVEWVVLSIVFSMFSNLVYPSVSSIVSKIVNENRQGEALGALNGIKALTEGIGPLTFGLLMSIFEASAMPGAPYLLAALLSIWALVQTFELLDNSSTGEISAMKLARLHGSKGAGGDGEDESAGLMGTYELSESDVEG